MALNPPPVRAQAVAEIRTSLLRWIGAFDPFGPNHKTR